MHALHATGNSSNARYYAWKQILYDRAEALNFFVIMVLASQGTMQDGQGDGTPSTCTLDSSGRALDVVRRASHRCPGETRKEVPRLSRKKLKFCLARLYSNL